MGKTSKIFLIFCGAVLILIALFVYLTQNSQKEVTAQILNEKCRTVYYQSSFSNQTLCDLKVSYNTKDGKVIQTNVSKALPTEITKNPGKPDTIQLRYNSSDPYNPYKQSNYMSLGTFIGLLVGGILIFFLAFIINRAYVKKAKQP